MGGNGLRRWFIFLLLLLCACPLLAADPAEFVPQPGSSGLQLRVQLSELLEGFRPGRIVRFRPSGFPNVKLPPEERVNNFDDR